MIRIIPSNVADGDDRVPFLSVRLRRRRVCYRYHATVALSCFSRPMSLLQRYTALTKESSFGDKTSVLQAISNGTAINSTRGCPTNQVHACG